MKSLFFFVKKKKRDFKISFFFSNKKKSFYFFQKKKKVSEKFMKSLFFFRKKKKEISNSVLSTRFSKIVTLTQFTLNYPTEFCPHGFQKSLFFLAKKKKKIFLREGEWGGSKGTSGIYTIHAKLFNSVLSKRFSKISFIYQKKKKRFLEGGGGFWVLFWHSQ